MSPKASLEDIPSKIGQSLPHHLSPQACANLLWSCLAAKLWPPCPSAPKPPESCGKQLPCKNPTSWAPGNRQTKTPRYEHSRLKESDPAQCSHRHLWPCGGRAACGAGLWVPPTSQGLCLAPPHPHYRELKIKYSLGQMTPEMFSGEVIAYWSAFRKAEQGWALEYSSGLSSGF